MNTFGEQVIAELKAHGEWGDCFTSEEYAEISKLVTPDDFSNFARCQGRSSLVGISTPQAIRLALRDNQSKQGMKWFAVGSIVDGVLAPFTLIPSLFMGLLFFIVKRDRNKVQPPPAGDAETSAPEE